MNEADIRNAQRTWGDAVVNVGEATDHAEATQRAEALVNALYVTDGSLLFAPTKAAEIQFRPTVESAVSYFVGGNGNFPEDKGFALEPWTSVRFENTGIVLRADCGIAMGNYFFGKADGSELKVEYSFVYIEDEAGNIRVQLHHSALPYAG